MTMPYTPHGGRVKLFFAVKDNNAWANASKSSPKRPATKSARAITLSGLELERLEHRIDLEDARKRLNEPTVLWFKIKRQLGL
jgi:hypothetical protein